MKTILFLAVIVTAFLFTACESGEIGRGEGLAPVVGAPTGVPSQSTHSGNSDGSRTDLR
jgi:hypothetical protein